MYRRFLIFILAHQLIAGIVFAWTYTSHMDGTYPNLGGNWSCVDSSPGHGEIATDTNTPDPSTVLKLTYPVGFYNGNYAAKCWNMIPGEPTELWVQYYFKYSSNYYFHPIDNKQTYYFTGTVGNNWFIGVAGDRHINMITQTFATDRHYPNTGYNPYINANQWYKLSAHFILNTPGVMNGILQIWVNDGLVINKTNIGYINQSEGIREAEISPIFGGNTGVSKPAEDYQYYDLVIISTSPISGGTLPSSISKNPMPPSNIKMSGSP